VGQSDVVRAADVTLDIPRMQAKVGKRAIDLTSTEFELLAMMMRQPGRVFTRGQLLDAVRGDAVESLDRVIDAHIKNLRRKLERDPGKPRYLLTVYGVGYKFAEE
jgi:DNA-binding response OmpR family regulator